MTCPSYWHDALIYLLKRDETLAKLITAFPDATLINQHNPFHTLMRAIVGQQISVKAADAVWFRLEALLKSISPEAYLGISPEELRQCGLSRQKIAYITHVALAFQDRTLNPENWQTMDDEAVIKQLTAIKGVGLWTAQMFLIFNLHRPNVLPLADLGLINALHRHYGNGQKLSKTDIIRLSQRWEPYRTVATWYLWRSLDPVTVQY